MIRMSAVWDRTTEVLNARGGILAGIAVLTVALPSLVQGLVSGGTLVAPTIARSFVTLLAFGLAVWGTLAMTAVASESTTGRAAGFGTGARALPRTLLILVLLGVAAMLLFAPAIVLLLRSGYDFAAAQRGDAAGAIANASLRPLMLYVLLALLVALVVGARLALLYPVLVNERVSLGAFARSLALTRGLTLRILGVLLLYLLVLLVAMFAAQAVFGTIFRIVLGADATLAAVLTAAVVTAVVTVFSVLQTVFAAQLYASVRDSEPHEAPRVPTGPWG